MKSVYPHYSHILEFLLWYSFLQEICESKWKLFAITLQKAIAKYAIFLSQYGEKHNFKTSKLFCILGTPNLFSLTVQDIITFFKNIIERFITFPLKEISFTKFLMYTLIIVRKILLNSLVEKSYLAENCLSIKIFELH